MTGREIIRSVIESCENLDDEVVMHVLDRDEHNAVTRKRCVDHYFIVNGKIKVESRNWVTVL